MIGKKVVIYRLKAGKLEKNILPKVLQSGFHDLYLFKTFTLCKDESQRTHWLEKCFEMVYIENNKQTMRNYMGEEAEKSEPHLPTELNYTCIYIYIYKRPKWGTEQRSIKSDDAILSYEK